MKISIDKPGWRYLLIEWILLFAGVPLLLYFNLLPIPKIAFLLIVTLLCFLLLRMDTGYSIDELRSIPGDGPFRRNLLLKSLTALILIFLLTLIVQPQNLLGFPREQPGVWLLVMVLYPFLSALPQEFIYREFFYRRYSDLFASSKTRIVLSAAAFSYMHLIYDNWWAIGLSLVGGILFSLTYERTNSLVWTSIEHAVYGSIVFTIGMGNYFYEPF